ncbi:response regulator [Candidatus Sulfurimonas marisnigri]|uniref:Response regulator n=1 Tax=Candidatus Sulfurimonas marisnigri TaxID=2740405 RepID=A0A7S7M1T1_9BACT|nr:response regulator [Candidatus Sulfurimonas marisnigri]QOY55547.1 response regulator [Candidatus Sulfurimonas marisnigri]
MEIINEYIIETVVAIALVIILILYFLIRKPKQIIKEDVTESVVDVTIGDVPKDNKILEVESVAKDEPTVPDTKRIKRAVVYHDKIKKVDFEIFKGVRILVAEDNLINQKVITALLATSGIDITMASDGQIALDILKDDSDFSLILMDAHMPNIDGFQATRLIRKNPDYNHIPVIALSGDTATDDINNMYKVGMEQHLEKPLKMDNLYDVLYMYTSGDESNNGAQHSTQTSAKFDIEVGLDVCGGDKEFYIEILNDFTSKYSDSSKQLQEYISNQDAINANKMLLDISGVAANIGADYLHNVAIKLKNSIEKPEDLEYVTNLKEYKRALAEVCAAIEEYKQT